MMIPEEKKSILGLTNIMIYNEPWCNRNTQVCIGGNLVLQRRNYTIYHIFLCFVLFTNSGVFELSFCFLALKTRETKKEIFDDAKTNGFWFKN